MPDIPSSSSVVKASSIPLVLKSKFIASDSRDKPSTSLLQQLDHGHLVLGLGARFSSKTG